MAKANVTGALQKLKDRKARVRFQDQQARVSQDQDPARPRWTAFVQDGFGHDAVGEGATKEAAARAAIAELPPHIRRHFEGAALGDRAPKRKPRTLDNFAPGTALEAMDETRMALMDAGKAIRRGDCAEAARHVTTADHWLTEGATRGFASKPLTASFFDTLADLRACRAPRARKRR